MRTEKTLAIDTILIVEDDLFISMDAADAAERAGVNVITAESVEEALIILDIEHVSAAILDFQVRDGMITPVVQKLRVRGIPFRVVSGSTFQEIADNGIPRELCTAKPADYSKVVNALSPGQNGFGSARHH